MERDFQHDGTGQLATISQLDALGNRTTAASYGIDADGSITSSVINGTTTTFGWDVDGRLARVDATTSSSTATTKYQYDWQGWRRQKIGASGTVNYLWDATGLAEENGEVYERAGGLVLAANGQRLLHDAQSVIGSINSQGPPTLYRYDAWGNYRTDGNHVTPSATGPSQAYGGQLWDADVGLSYAEQRWYDPSTGRFLSEDPVLPFGRLMGPMGIHPFGYAGTNPLTFTDPDGRYVPGERSLADAEESESQQEVINTKIGTPEHAAAWKRYNKALAHTADLDEQLAYTRHVVLPTIAIGVVAVAAPVAVAAGPSALAAAAPIAPAVTVGTLAFTQTSGQATLPMVAAPVVSFVDCLDERVNTPDRAEACIDTVTNLALLDLSAYGELGGKGALLPDTEDVLGGELTSESGTRKPRQTKGKTLVIPKGKANLLRDYERAASEGKLIRTDPETVRKSGFRKRLTKEIGQPPGKGYDADHKIELCLNGADCAKTNGQWLKKTPNRSAGASIGHQVAKHPLGTKYTKVKPEK